MAVPFSRVRELFERHGWRLVRLWGSYRVFWDRPGAPGQLPWLVEVDENKDVSDVAFRKIQQFFGEEEPQK